MNQPVYSYSTTAALPTAVVNKTLRNTYALLGMLFVFASGTAWVSQAMHLRIGFIPFVVGIIGLSFAINATRNSVWGLFWSFAFAALLEKEGKLSEAATAYNMALSYADKDDKVSPTAFHRAFHFFQREKQEAKALAVLERGINRFPNEFSLRLALGDLYTRQGLHRKAEAEYRYALRLKPGEDRVTERLAERAGTTN